MLYIFVMDEKVYVSSIDPDSTDDAMEILANSIEAKIDNPRRMSIETQAGIVRNIISNGSDQKNTVLK